MKNLIVLEIEKKIREAEVGINNFPHNGKIKYACAWAKQELEGLLRIAKQTDTNMKYGLMIIRPDGSYDFYSQISTLHEREGIKHSYQYFQRQLKEQEVLGTEAGIVYRKPIQR